MFLARIIVTLRPSILDPRGKASLEALKNLGFDNVKSARMGKVIDLEIDAASKDEAREIAADAARKLLANEVMEDFEIEFPEAVK